MKNVKRPGIHEKYYEKQTVISAEYQNNIIAHWIHHKYSYHLIHNNVFNNFVKGKY